jgi:hypothetical protein
LYAFLPQADGSHDTQISGVLPPQTSVGLFDYHVILKIIRQKMSFEKCKWQNELPCVRAQRHLGKVKAPLYLPAQRTRFVINEARGLCGWICS